MAANVIVDTGFLVGLLNRRDTNHSWAKAVAANYPRPWKTCDAALAEAFHLSGPPGLATLFTLLRRGLVSSAYSLASGDIDDVLNLMHKFANVPMSLADACLVRMTEILPDPLLLTTDTDFRIYRRHGRQIVPCIIPD